MPPPQVVPQILFSHLIPTLSADPFSSSKETVINMAVDASLRYRPVVAFDVDGVLRVFKQPDDKVELVAAQITMFREEYPDVFHGKPKWGPYGESTYLEHFSTAGMALIQSIVANPAADAVWATTWQRWANYYFASVLGVPELPVAVKTLEPLEANRFHCSPAWKAHQLSRQFDGRPLIWIDDNMPDRYYEMLEGQRRPQDRALTLTYKVNSYTGITLEDAVNIEAWIEKASTPEGQKELRAERAAMLRKQRAEKARIIRKNNREDRMFDRTRARVLEMLPNDDSLAVTLAYLFSMTPSGSPHVEDVKNALKREGVEANAEELIRVIKARK